MARYRLLFQLTFAQLLAVVIGLGSLSLAYFLGTRETFETALKNERAKIILSLGEQQVKWRTWKQLGLDEALQHEVAGHSRVFALTELTLKPASELKHPISDREVAIPDPSTAAPETWIVYARLDADKIEAEYVPYRSNLLLIGLSGVLFCFVIFLSSRYIRKNVYMPFQELREAFENCNAGKEVDTQHIRASGEIREFIVSLVDVYKKLKENEKNAAMIAVAKQVAHDIRSPLAALDMILDTLPQLPERKRLIIRGALGRIREIANHVLERGRKSSKTPSFEVAQNIEEANNESLIDNSPVSIHSVASLIEEIVNEKQVLVRERSNVQVVADVDDSAYRLFAEVAPQVFKTVLSNLINNALESIHGRGTVRVGLSGGEGLVKVTVADNGSGMSAQTLEKVRGEGGSFGKVEGSGLGLTHARTAVAKWKGRLRIDSQLGQGTTVTLDFAQVTPPKWFVPELVVAEGSTVAILDDDPSIHLVWQQRFNDAMKLADAGVYLQHFSDTTSFRRWLTENPRLASHLLFLCDYEIVGAEENGLELINSLHLEKRAILVTGRFDEPAVRSHCEVKGIRLLPKGLGGCVPVIVQRAQNQVDAVLVDDDPLVHMTWELAAKSAEKVFRGFFTVDDFLRAASTIDPATPVYVDRNLGTDEPGDVAVERFTQVGFKHVFLATGDEEGGKNPPWNARSGQA